MPDPRRTVRTEQVIAQLGRFRPIDRRTALAHGLTDGQLRAALKAGRLVSLQPGTLLAMQAWTCADEQGRHLSAVLSALLRHPRAVVSHRSAAFMHGLPYDLVHPQMCADSILGPVPIVDLTQPGRGRREPRLRIFPGPLPGAHRELVHGFECTSIARTVLDLATSMPPDQALALIDIGLRRLIAGANPGREIRRLVVDPEQRAFALNALLTTAADLDSKRGIKTLGRLIRLGEPAAESILESLSRWQMRAHRLPMPQCQLPVLGEDGCTYWADFTWADLRIIGEADGVTKYVTRADHVREKLRQEALERAGWLVVRWTWREAVVTPTIMTNRIKAAIARRQLPGRRTA